ncbi:Toxin secretion, membrane fusion protein [Vibrio jasicida]|jgi:membrane fusion protein|uniref:Toxin secretion, membrane fusion protein n=1 Tax=Vibrio jasicida TaxID=766224 RepID=A0AAU9QXZ6_9VIBR|nr:HlyD family efflux transporter periplasmic adaptor subunit [Vibrio campbellii]MCE7732603.1 HlyD family efflux transporter periplasmic adaptor subunit [Vibrio campbellii]CAH1584176.1 Toxin secretion, membrane fusion protein [Vibrio jasicida]CAH1602989.1 Toxin secretion, membrane fusion protein [Vibrio jasicida]
MLFRKEAVSAKKTHLAGKVILIQPPSLYVISVSTFVLFLLTLIYLTQSNYSRKETVKGYLLPEKGVMKVYSGRDGVLGELLIKEGQKVEKGQPIVKIRNSQSLVSGVELSYALSREIKYQIEALEQELQVMNIIYQKDNDRITHQLTQLDKSYNAIKKTKDTSRERLKIKEHQLNNNKKLFDSGFISSSQFSSVHENYLETLEATDRLERELASISVDIGRLQSEKASIPEQRLLKQAVINRQVSELKEKLVEQKNQFEFIKTAPEAGIVTAIQPSIGTQVNSNSPILSIIPENSPLEIELLLPTRSAGFVKLGDEVKIRFDAFPYQKFGVASGKILSIDQSVILPTDKVLPIEVTEAMYRVRANLRYQSIVAYGKTFPLKVGMTADADIILEKRSLLEWLLDPIYAVKGKIG